MHKIRIIGFFFENRIHWLSEVGKRILQTAVLGYIFIDVPIIHYYIISYVFDNWGKNVSH